MKLETIGTKGRSSLERRPQLIESVDESMIGLMRLILASSALLIIYIDPAEPDHFVRATYAALVLYVVYSLILYLTSLSRRPALQWRFYWAHWVDVLWFTVFISLSSGTNSVFFFFYYFSILIASFRWGFGSGVLVTIVSSVLFTVMGYLFGPSNVDLNRLLLRPLSLLVLGYMIAYWGGFEIELRRRLKFLKEITRLSNPRFGVDRTINWAMEQFRSFYNADSCLLILSNRSADYHSLRRIDRVPENCTTSSEALGPEVAKLFLSFPPGEAVIYKRYARGYLLNIQTGETSKIKSSNVLVANLLDSRAFLSVPVNYRGETIGRLYIVGDRTRFVLSDVDFVLQAIDQVIPVIDNIRLVDHLASDAAERERERIARDIHDSVIQPYIGFQLGLTAIRQKVERGDKDALQQINDLSELTAKGIADLRHYVGEIKAGDRPGNILLMPALRRYAAKFTQATGIDVIMEADQDMSINDRLAAELFQMIIEGLSNIRRHTNAQFARAELTQDDGHLTLRIENENLDGQGAISFHPRSLAERASALGGQLGVDTNENNRTIVTIQIPL